MKCWNKHFLKIVLLLENQSCFFIDNFQILRRRVQLRSSDARVKVKTVQMIVRYVNHAELKHIWAASCKKVTNVLSHCHTKNNLKVWCHTKRRRGWLPTHPSFGMTTIQGNLFMLLGSYHFYQEGRNPLFVGGDFFLVM